MFDSVKQKSEAVPSEGGAAHVQIPESEMALLWVLFCCVNNVSSVFCINRSWILVDEQGKFYLCF